MLPLSAQRKILVLLAAGLISGCQTGYYLQAAGGHFDLMRRAQPVASLLDDPATPPATRARLELASEALAFAHSELHLPDNGSYRRYTDLGRRYVVWNVVATPEFALEAVQWCFPVAGCLPYRGWFSERRAQQFAAELRAAGKHVHVGGVSAYSTLGRFADPLLNTMLEWPAAELAGLLFHELAHQLIYIQDDAAFNEGFATLVEREGLRRFLLATGREPDLCRYQEARRWRGQVLELVNGLRADLAASYASGLPADELRIVQVRLYSLAHRAYAELAAASGMPLESWAGLFPLVPNNARLAALATYEDTVPAFARLLREQDGDIRAFYQAVAELAALPPAERSAQLAALTRRAAGDAEPAMRGCAG